MTGFARQEGSKDSRSWVWEIKSVNAKGLDVRCRLGGGFEHLEQLARDLAKKKFSRGNLSVSLIVVRDKSDAAFRVNHVVLGELLATLPEIQKQIPEMGPPSIDGLLALRGVIEPLEEDPTEEDQEALDKAVLDDLSIALEALADMRNEEGARLSEIMEAFLNEIARLCGAAEKLAAAQPAAIKARLEMQIQTLLDGSPPVAEDRLAQEVALLVSKADLREELDRLKAHQEAASGLLAEEGSVGRKLDFLCQEFNREANTLCSKSQDVELTRIGLDLKAVIEQFREQVQNIE
ncbi:MAG: YicC family protein [Rhodospirillales bacterium]|nr:YicC family protein [Rhodospirillales bacterium]